MEEYYNYKVTIDPTADNAVHLWNLNYAFYPEVDDYLSPAFRPGTAPPGWDPPEYPNFGPFVPFSITSFTGDEETSLLNSFDARWLTDEYQEHTLEEWHLVYCGEGCADSGEGYWYIEGADDLETAPLIEPDPNDIEKTPYEVDLGALLLVDDAEYFIKILAEHFYTTFVDKIEEYDVQVGPENEGHVILSDRFLGTAVEHVVSDKGLTLLAEGGPTLTKWRGIDVGTDLFRTDSWPDADVTVDGFDFGGEGPGGPAFRRGLDIDPGDGGVSVKNCWIHGFDHQVIGGNHSLLLRAERTLVEGCSIWGNIGSNHGGGANVAGWASAIIRDNWFSNNQVMSYESYGAGLFLLGSRDGVGLIKDNVFIFNGIKESHGQSMSGAFSLTGGEDPPEYLVTGNYFEGNEAHLGGACDGTSGAPFVHNIFVRNIARPDDSTRESGRGGALTTSLYDYVTLSQILFLGNSAEWATGYGATEPLGASILLEGSGSYLGSNIFMESSGAAAIYSYSGSNRAVANVMWQNAEGDFGGALIDTSAIIHSDPLLFAPDQGDFRLMPGSPCIDAGDPDPPAGLPRRDPDGTPPDIGAIFFDQSDFNILYVVPHSLRGYAGAPVTLRALAANLAEQPRSAELSAVLSREDGPPLATWTRPVRFPAEGAWHDEVSLDVPERTPPGRYRLVISLEDDVEEVALDIRKLRDGLGVAKKDP